MVKLFRAILMLSIISMPVLAGAQPPEFEEPFGVKDVPFDDNIYILIAVAIIYGGLKIWSHKKAEKNKKILLHH